MLALHVPDDLGQIIAQHPIRSTNANLPAGSLAELRADGVDVFEKRLRKGEHLPARGREPERLPFEKLHAEILLKLPDLAADRRLLNPIGHAPHRRTDSAMTRNVVKQLQVMDVHPRIIASHQRAPWQHPFREAHSLPPCDHLSINPMSHIRFID